MGAEDYSLQQNRDYDKSNRLCLALPLSLEISAESVEKKYVGAANSVLYEFSQIGALLVIVMYESTAALYGWNSVLVTSAILVLGSFLLAVLITEKRGRFS